MTEWLSLSTKKMNNSVLRLFFFSSDFHCGIEICPCSRHACMRILSESKEVTTGRVHLSFSVHEERWAGSILPVQRSVNGHASHDPFQWVLLEGRSKFLPPWDQSASLHPALSLLDMHRPLYLDLSPGFSSSVSIHRFPYFLPTSPATSCSKHWGFC